MADGWDRHDEEQKRAWLKLTPEQRLAALVQLKNFALQCCGLGNPILRDQLEKDPARYGKPAFRW